MSTLTLFTSGSTKDPKEVVHPWDHIKQCASRSIQEIGLTSADIVLNVFPGNTIAHYTVTSMPAHYAGAELITANFEPYSYMKLFNKHQPSYIALIPRHWEILSKTKGWEDFDMSSVRYMVVGSGICSQHMIDDFRSKGVQLVANWYGMTEMPPPVFVGYNSEAFDFTPNKGYTVEFADDGECIVNGQFTGDIFDVNSKKFLHRKSNANNNTWKTTFNN
jgi:acyl-[acyl-carrier-protein]-phospholipid O-acyltransferase/long-chain-fatty-acid--[acyl-carrier-protein] ligase